MKKILSILVILAFAFQAQAQAKTKTKAKTTVPAKTEVQAQPQVDPNLPRVIILATGGTIAGAGASPHSAESAWQCPA